MNTILALITARGGSKSIKKKNIVEVAGRPLIAWTISAAKRAPGIDRLVISTDDPEIASVAEAWGAEVPFMRPQHLALDNSPHIPVLQHAIEWFKDNHGLLFTYLLLLQPTSPLLRSFDINNAIALAKRNDAASVVSVCKTFSHPIFLKTIDSDGFLQDYAKRPQGYHPKQNLPPVYFENGSIYLVKCDILMHSNTLFPPGTMPYIMPQARSLQIDSPWELKVADLILRSKDGVSDENSQE